MNTVHPNMTEAKTLISSSDEAKEMGRWDAEQGRRSQAEQGRRSQADNYHYADANSIHGSYLRGEYVYSFIQAKGL